ncbi:beta-N-acetylhexosaminidase [Sinomicrobium sp. M5D2P17]
MIKIRNISTILPLLLLLLLSNGKQVFAVSPQDFEIRGFHLDLRIQVMRMPALKDFALKLSKNGINTLLMEWEATYPYEKHRVISGPYAYSREEVISFISYCDSIGLDVIPLQQSFGHVEYILRHPRYKELREDRKDYSQVNPTKEALCKKLFTDLYKDIISTHTSEYIHIGGDETYLLGHSEASRKKAEAMGMGRLYGDYLKMLCEAVINLGKRPVIWADIALKYPEALELLPEETILMDWNYGWELDRFGDHRNLEESGFEIWGAPALRSGPDNYFLTDWNKHLENIRTFIPQARSLGYKGIVMTSWSTSGIYAPVFESATDIIDLHAVRRVYPITGFDLLIEAYFEALKSDTPLVPDDFMTKYCVDTYGFDPSEAQKFRKALTTAPYEVNQGVVSHPGMDVSQLRDSAVRVRNMLQELKPEKNRKNYQHHLLMADIRVHYLSCIAVEEEMNRESFDSSKIPKLLGTLNDIPWRKTDGKFIRLNRQVFYVSELEKENRLRNKRRQTLIGKLQ